MAEMLIQSENLVAIADKIRVLKDISQSMSLDDMEAQLDIPKNDSSDLTASGATVAVPAGYYASQATKSVATATQATPSVSIDSEGKITATATQTAGYVSAGTKTSTHQLAFQAAKTYTPTTANQTISAGTYLTGVQTIKGDSNLVASNIKSGVSIFGVSGILVEGYGGGSGEQVEWSANEDAIISGTISGTYTNDRISHIKDGAFENCESLTTVDFPICTTIGSYAFYYCNNLATASFPACSIIGNNAFDMCDSLATVSFPACSIICDSAFGQCDSLATASFPACMTICSYAFEKCESLTTVDFPICTTIGNNAFYYCSNLATASFPACSIIGNSAFGHCFYMSQLYLAAHKVCQLSNSNAFNATPYEGNNYYFSGTPYIYVPSSLVDVYKTATNWAYFSSYFSAIDSSDGENDNVFYLNGVKYQAEEGMTFSDWVSSEYNIDGWRIMGPYLAYPDRSPYQTVKSTDVIEFGCSY